jgi:hypothetical protein
MKEAPDVTTLVIRFDGLCSQMVNMPELAFPRALLRDSHPMLDVTRQNVGEPQISSCYKRVVLRTPTAEINHGVVTPISYDTNVHSDVTAVGVGSELSARLPKKKKGVGNVAGAAGSAEYASFATLTPLANNTTLSAAYFATRQLVVVEELIVAEPAAIIAFDASQKPVLLDAIPTWISFTRSCIPRNIDGELGRRFKTATVAAMYALSVVPTESLRK